MRPAELLDRLGVREAVLVSYDIPARDAYARTAVHRVLYGRREAARTERKAKGYWYPGLVPEWAERLGQTVVLIHPDKSSELTEILRAHRVPHRARTVYLDW